MSDGDADTQAIATAYCDDGVSVDQLTALVGAKTAQRLRLLKADLENEPLELSTPDDINVYDGDATAVDTAADDCG
jgi:ribulose kinase